MNAVIGMLGALVGIGLFMFGFLFGKTGYQTKPTVVPDTSTDEEKAAIREEREKLIQDQKAFRELMSYNSDMAYGLADRPVGKSG